MNFSLGSDQVTVARARGSIAIRNDHHTRQECLQRLLPVVEDWHAKQCLLKVYCIYCMLATFANSITRCFLLNTEFLALILAGYLETLFHEHRKRNNYYHNLKHS